MNISKSELQVLEILWQEQPLTVGQIIERVQKAADWHENTIKTLLTRLTEKGAVERFRDGRRYFYLPVLAREAVVEQEAEGLLSRYFNGRMAPLLAHFADRRKLSERDVEEIEQILAELKNDDR